MSHADHVIEAALSMLVAVAGAFVLIGAWVFLRSPPPPRTREGETDFPLYDPATTYSQPGRFREWLAVALEKFAAKPRRRPRYEADGIDEIEWSLPQDAADGDGGADGGGSGGGDGGGGGD